MQRTQRRHYRPGHGWATLLVVALAALPFIPLEVGRVQAQQVDSLTPNVSIFARGLIAPRGLKFGPDGFLYVAESGVGGTTKATGQQVPPPVGPYTGGKTARISKISPAGVRTTVVDGLPSTITSKASGSEPGGVGDVAFVNGTLYALLFGGGASHGNPDLPNGILRVTPAHTTTLLANLSAFLRARLGMTFYAVEPNHGELDKITLAGHISRVADISFFMDHIVPTSVAVGPDGNFYIGNLSTIPYLDGKAVILKVTPQGQVSIAATGLTTVLGVAFDRQGRLYALESSTGNPAKPPFLLPGTGKVVRRTTAGTWETVAAGLTFPTAMTFGRDGKLYVSNFGYHARPGQGQIVRISLRS
jgi:hypothetical protein